MTNDSNEIRALRERVERLEANAPEGEPFTDEPTSIEGHREVVDDASGYLGLRAEVEALEAADDLGGVAREAVTVLRNKMERPPLNQDGSNDANSAEIRGESVDRVRAIARRLASADPAVREAAASQVLAASAGAKGR